MQRISPAPAEVHEPAQKPESILSSPFKLRQSIAVLRDLGMTKRDIMSYLRRFTLMQNRSSIERH